MHRRDEFDALDMIDAQHGASNDILCGAQSHDEVCSHAHFLQTSEDWRQSSNLVQSERDIPMVLGVVQTSAKLIDNSNKNPAAFSEVEVWIIDGKRR